MSAWMEHVKKTQAENPTFMLKEVLKLAGKTYKKGSSISTGEIAKKSTKKSMKKSMKKPKKQSKGKGKGKKQTRKTRKTRKQKKSRGKK